MGVVRVRNLHEMVNPGELGVIKDKVMSKVHVACSGPAQLSLLQYGKVRRAWYLFSHEHN